MTNAILILAAVLLLIDWAQTLRIAREPERYREAWNVVLPEHPSVMRAHVWFGFVVLFAGVALWLLPWARLPLGVVGIVIEGACVVNNFSKGLKP